MRDFDPAYDRSGSRLCKNAMARKADRIDHLSDCDFCNFAARRCCCALAACRTSAAKNDSGDWAAQPQSVRRRAATYSRPPPRSERLRLCRGSKCYD
jgi:hypothetical protein